MEGVGLSGTLGRFEILRLLLQDLNLFFRRNASIFGVFLVIWGFSGGLEDHIYEVWTDWQIMVG